MMSMTTDGIWELLNWNIHSFYSVHAVSMYDSHTSPFTILKINSQYTYKMFPCFHVSLLIKKHLDLNSFFRYFDGWPAVIRNQLVRHFLIKKKGKNGPISLIE